MEFESPDVERDFPGLYASESGRRSNESDFSDESHERLSKKDLLIGKRKDKKDSKKDRGYATLEGESSPEEDADIKSPSKSKKSKPFKFPSKKEKQREKSREKDGKERDHEKDKERKKSDDKDKDKKKEAKVKFKKERKKSKHSDDSAEIDDLPVFGVPLSLAVERSKCHDGVNIPLVVRDCIDHIQQAGMTVENVYKTSGIKSRVQHVRRLYNLREAVQMSDYDLSVATTLLKVFLRELPEPLLTTELLTRFEEAGALRDVSTRGAHFKTLVEKLPSCNRSLLAWLLKHFDSITQHEKQNKMNAQSIATAFSPLMQTSERLITALLCHTSAIFPDLELTKYVPPLTSASPALPETCEGISQELRKQESLLGQIHSEMNQCRVSKSREEQLWEVQRIVTQLKRKLRALERGGQRSLDEADTSSRVDDDLDLSLQRGLTVVASTSASSAPSVSALPIVPQPLLTVSTTAAVAIATAAIATAAVPALVVPPTQGLTPPAPTVPVQPLPPPTVPVQPLPPPTVPVQPLPPPTVPVQPLPPPTVPVQPLPPPTTRQASVDSSSSHQLQPQPPTNSLIKNAESLEVEDINRATLLVAEKRQKAILETEELVSVVKKLKELCHKERVEVDQLRARIDQLGGIPVEMLYLSESSDDDEKMPSFDENGLWKKRQLLRDETSRLEMKKRALVESICLECDMCIDLRVQIKLMQMTRNHH